MCNNCVGGYYKIIGELLLLANIICIEINIAFGNFGIVVMNSISILLCISCMLSD